MNIYEPLCVSFFPDLAKDMCLIGHMILLRWLLHLIENKAAGLLAIDTWNCSLKAQFTWCWHNWSGSLDKGDQGSTGDDWLRDA
jgi:hypothetical protein